MQFNCSKNFFWAVKQAETTENRDLELTCGTRIWYFYGHRQEKSCAL